MKQILINDNLVKEEEAKISVFDRGFRFGDGIFETILLRNGQLLDFSLHKKRLEQGLKDIKINFKLEKIESDCQRLIKENKLRDAFIKIYITRGESKSAYLPEKNIKPNYVILSSDYQKPKERRFNLVISNYQKPQIRSFNSNAKIMQGLNSTLAMMEANEKKYDNAILLDQNNNISEAASANIFFVSKENKIFSPKLESGLVNGVIRQKLILDPEIEIVEEDIEVSDLDNFSNIFITNVNLRIAQIDKIFDQQDQIIWQSQNEDSLIMQLRPVIDGD